ncbi:MAG: MATE family efflux transporter [Butyrivibrio sp.]|nr:MATE family efflux transporter [Butyrivibrio sp.]
MTAGPIMRNVLLFALPIIAGNILQYLYTTVDTLVIGRFCGTTSLAAVGTSSQPVEVLLCIFLGVGTGVSIRSSQHTGAGDIRRMRETVRTSVSFVYLSGIPIGIIGYFLTPAILKLMGVPADVWNAALIYTRIVFLGALGNIGYNMNAGLLRGLGDSKASLWFLLISCIVNVLLDLVLVAGLRMDVSGAAAATAVAMFLSWFFSIAYIRRRYPELQCTWLPRGVVRAELRHILMIGLPIGLNSSLFSFGHMAMQTMVNAQGALFMAGNSIAGRVNGLANMAISAMSSAATTFSGQNYGARKVDRLRSGQVLIPLAAGLITLTFDVLCILIRMPILRQFSSDETVLFYASRFVVVQLSGQWMFAVYNSISNFINGLGRVRYTVLVSLLMLWAVRIPVAWLIARFWDGTWIMLSFPASFAFGMFSMIGYYIFSKTWKELLNLAPPRVDNMK